MAYDPLKTGLGFNRQNISTTPPPRGLDVSNECLRLYISRGCILLIYVSCPMGSTGGLSYPGPIIVFTNSRAGAAWVPLQGKHKLPRRKLNTIPAGRRVKPRISSDLLVRR